MNGIHAVTNIDIEILMNIQIFTLVKSIIFLLRGNSTIQFNQTSKKSKAGILIKLRKNLATIGSSL